MRRRRFAGRHTAVTVNETVGTVTATFDDGLVRVYSREEIADHVAQLVEDMVERPGDVSEPWYEFLREVIGPDAMATAIAMSAVLKPGAAPPGLRTRFDG